MKAVIQRVRCAVVQVDETVVGKIGHGLVVLLGVAQGDGSADAENLAEKICRLRMFSDERGKMNRALQDVGGAVLVISQFTLLANTRQGRRPSFEDAAGPDEARMLYETFVKQLRARGLPVETGAFGAHMVVSLENDGPVTLLLDTQSHAVAKT